MTRKNLCMATGIIVLACGGMVGAVTAATAQHDHSHADAPATLQLDAGKKWATDAPLRKAMTNIRNTVSAAVPAIHAGTQSDAQYDALAEGIRADVNYMVGNCKLSPRADAQLHAIIARLLEGANVMAGKAAGHRRDEGAVQVIGALSDYDSYFDHPLWQPIRH